MSKQVILLYLSGFSVYIGLMIDWYSYHIKREFLISQTIGVMSVANWIQYAGRIANMGGVFIMSILFESGYDKYEIIHVFCFALGFTALNLILGYRDKKFAFIPFLIQKILCINIFGIHGTKFYWSKIRVTNLNLLMFFSIIVNLAIMCALIAPIYAASFNPTYRMSFAYGGQFLNFASSIIVFAYIDRILYSGEIESTDLNISSIINGKLVASIVFPIFLVVSIL